MSCAFLEDPALIQYGVSGPVKAQVNPSSLGSQVPSSGSRLSEGSNGLAVLAPVILGGARWISPEPRWIMRGGPTIQTGYPPQVRRGPFRISLWLGFCLFLAIALFFLWAEHRAHVFGALTFVLLLLCPFIHRFMHRGAGGHGANHERVPAHDLSPVRMAHATVPGYRPARPRRRAPLVYAARVPWQCAPQPDSHREQRHHRGRVPPPRGGPAGPLRGVGMGQARDAGPLRARATSAVRRPVGNHVRVPPAVANVRDAGHVPRARHHVRVACVSGRTRGPSPVRARLGPVRVASADVGPPAPPRPWLAALAIANTVVSLVYYLRVLAPAYFDPPSSDVAVLGRWPAVGTFACAAAIVVAGLGADLLLRRFAPAALLPGG